PGGRHHAGARALSAHGDGAGPRGARLHRARPRPQRQAGQAGRDEPLRQRCRHAGAARRSAGDDAVILRRLALLSALGMTTLSTAQTAEAQVIAEPAPPPWPDPKKFAKGPFASGEVGTLVYLGR